MKSRRIHLMGASGAGVTTLGRALADRLALPHHDCDDYFWLPTAPPYRTTRPAADRLRLMREMFLPRHDWVLSGTATGWGDELVAYFDLVVFVVTPRELRLKRLRARVDCRPALPCRPHRRRATGRAARRAAMHRRGATARLM